MENGIYIDWKAPRYTYNMFRFVDGKCEAAISDNAQPTKAKMLTSQEIDILVENLKQKGIEKEYTFWRVETNDLRLSEVCSSCAAKYSFDSLTNDTYLRDEYASFVCQVCEESQTSPNATYECPNCSEARYDYQVYKGNDCCYNCNEKLIEITD